MNPSILGKNIRIFKDKTGKAFGEENISVATRHVQIHLYDGACREAPSSETVVASDRLQGELQKWAIDYR